MSWGYSDTDSTAGIHGEAQDNTMKNMMFANDGISENNQTIQALLKEGYSPEALQDALKAIQGAIQNGIPVSQMPVASVLPSAVLEQIYDEAAVQTGAPSSAELEADLAAERDAAMAAVRENLRDNAVAGKADTGALSMISPGSLNDIRNITRNPDLQMTIAEQGAKLAHMTEMDGKDHSLAELGGLSGPTVGQQQQREAGMFV